LSFIILDIVGGKPSSFVSKCSLPPTTFLSLSYGDYVTLPEAQLQKYVTCYNFFSKLSQHTCSLTKQNLPMIYLKPTTARTSSRYVIRLGLKFGDRIKIFYTRHCWDSEKDTLHSLYTFLIACMSCCPQQHYIQN